ncbi:hypothetical protein NDU88_008136 [Pleurodeles waltl]|uniref:Uncharacterized protein n=1 Tax=Pleurodeles waltl TaxID=8319 RepID=A0AAV7PNC3_PLEWA|nr:hypothetical protein NDU88_008136 [Pleurodeles waltl]
MPVWQRTTPDIYQDLESGTALPVQEAETGSDFPAQTWLAAFHSLCFCFLETRSEDGVLFPSNAGKASARRFLLGNSAVVGCISQFLRAQRGQRVVT